MRITSKALAITVLFLATACGIQGSPFSGAIPWRDPSIKSLLHISAANGVTAIDTAGGRVRFALPPAISTADHLRFFSASETDGQTRIDVYDGRDGRILGSQLIQGTYEPITASRSGDIVAVAPPRGPVEHWLAEGRERTDVVVANVGQGTVRTYALDGNYTPEAFSVAGDRLYVIEYLPPLTPDRYRVRQLDLSTGQVLPVGPRPSSPPKTVSVEEEMRGRSRMQALAPDGSRLYTLYVRDDHHLHIRDYPEVGGSGVPNPDVKAFVHVLSLNEGWAYCLDLPMPFGMGPAEAHTLALSPNGARLYVADASSALRVAVVDTNQVRIERVRTKIADTPAFRPEAPLALRASDSGTLFLAMNREIVVAREGRDGVRRHPLTEPALGLELDADGQKLYVIGSGQVSVLNAGTGIQEAAVILPNLASSDAPWP